MPDPLHYTSWNQPLPEAEAWRKNYGNQLREEQARLEAHQRNWNRVRNAAYVAAAVPFAAAAAPAVASLVGGGTVPTGSGVATASGATVPGITYATTPVAAGSLAAPTVGSVATGGAAAGGAAAGGGAVAANTASKAATAADLGQLLSGLAEGQATERGNRATYGLGRDRALADVFGTRQNALLTSLIAQDRSATDRYGTRQAATTAALGDQSREGIDRAKLGLLAPSTRAQQSVLGSLMQNLQPVSVSGGSAKQQGRMPVIRGGLTAAALDPMTRQQGSALLKQALQAQLSGSDVPQATNFMGGVLDAPSSPDYSKAIIEPPSFGEYPEAGAGESWLSGAGSAANIADTVWKLIRQSRGG